MNAEDIENIPVSKFNKEAILASLKANKNTLLDDHRVHCTDAERRVLIKYVLVYVNHRGEEYVIPAWEFDPYVQSYDYFCINPLYVGTDGEVHLRQWSVGGTIMVKEYGSLAKAVATYNEHSMGASWYVEGRDLIKEIIAL